MEETLVKRKNKKQDNFNIDKNDISYEEDMKELYLTIILSKLSNNGLLYKFL